MRARYIYNPDFRLLCEYLADNHVAQIQRDPVEKLLRGYASFPQSNVPPGGAHSSFDNSRGNELHAIAIVPDLYSSNFVMFLSQSSQGLHGSNISFFG